MVALFILVFFVIFALIGLASKGEKNQGKGLGLPPSGGWWS